MPYGFVQIIARFYGLGTNFERFFAFQTSPNTPSYSLVLRQNLLGTLEPAPLDIVFWNQPCFKCPYVFFYILSTRNEVQICLKRYVDFFRFCETLSLH